MTTTTSIQDYTLTTAESHHIKKIQQVLAKNGSRPTLAASILTGRHMDHHHHHQNNHNHNTQIPFSRTLLWKTALLQIDITHGVLEMTALRSCRDAYTNVVKNIGIPWHLLSEDSIYYKAIDNNLDDLQVGEDLANLQITPDTLTTSINVKKPVPKQEVKGDDDPLSSLHTEKTGTNTFFSKPRKDESDLDVLLTIIGDVERLFPEHPGMFISSMEDKVRIITVLYRYAKWINHERESQGLKRMGYVQGMHELCGVLYAVLKVELVKRKQKTTTDSEGDGEGEGEGNANRNEQGGDLTDTICDSKDDNVYDNLIITPEHQKQQLQIIEFLSADYFEHDLFAMFQQLMSPIIDKYFTSSGIVRESIVFDLKLHHLDPGNGKHPGLATCLKKAGIESQLWLTRWFRMILTRELGLAYSVRLWDGLIAYACVGAMADTATNGHDISVLLPYVVMLLVIRIRSPLLKSMVPCIAEAYHEHVENNGEGSIDGNMDGHVITDETEALSLLLHYPTSSELGVALSRSVSPEPTSDNIDDDDDDSDGDDIHMANGVTTNGGNVNKEPMLMYRKSRDLHKQSRFKAPLERCMALHKLPSAVDLFADAAHICGLSDSELTQVGPSLIEKYAGGDVYDLIDSIEKSKPSPNHFFEGVMKTTRLWRMTSSNSKSSTHASMKSGNKPPMHIKSEEKPDGNRTRLEMKLQQRVQDRLRDRSGK